MTQHLSVRIPWKDNGYNGLVCDKPCFNNACLRLKNIAGERDDNLETSLAGKKIKGHESEIPCLNEGGCFMSDETYVRTTVHPYKNTSPSTHGHFTETELVYPPFSFPARPYAWTMLNKGGQFNDENIKWLIEKYDIGFDPDKEPDLYFHTNWAQHAENQRAIFKSFYENVEPSKSLLIPYAKQVPFVDDAKRVVMGVGFITSVIEPPEHNYSEKKKIRSILWETMLGHSIRDDRSNGFLLPYREMMEYAEEHPDFDIRDITVFADDEYFDEFSYATEHLSYDAVISVLLKIIKSLEIIKNCIPGNWNECIRWTRERLNEVWLERGVFPGFESMLYAIGIKHNYVISNEIKKHIKNESEFENKVEEILNKPKAYLSERAVGFLNNTVVSAFLSLPKERKDLFWLLSRMSLTDDQAVVIFNPEERKHIGINVTDREILDNPYIVYEATRNLIPEYVISAKKIDMAVFQPEIIRNINPLDEPTAIESENDARRIRAYVVSQLEEEAVYGHTVYPADFIVKDINDLPIDPECHISGDILNGVQGFLEGELSVITCEDGSLAYQLNRLKAYDEIIRKSIRKRLSGPRHPVDEDWEKIVDEEFERKGLKDFEGKELLALGLFDSIKNRIKSKSEAKKELAERIKNEEVQLSSFEKDYLGKYIYRYNYKNHENTFRELQLKAIKIHVSTKSYQAVYSDFIDRVENHNRKIEAIITNAKCFQKIREEYGSFDAYLWAYTDGKTILYNKHGDGYIPVSNGLSDEISKDLKKRGFKYLGTVTVYSHLQACGMINDHGSDCPCYKRINASHPTIKKRRDKEKQIQYFG